MATFFWSEQHVCEEMVGAQGWAYFGWAKMNRITFFGGSMEMTGGYVAQEISKLRKIK